MARADEGPASRSETGPSVITGQLGWKRETERVGAVQCEEGSTCCYWLLALEEDEGPSAKECRRLPGAGKAASHSLMFSPLRPMSEF